MCKVEQISKVGTSKNVDVRPLLQKRGRVQLSTQRYFMKTRGRAVAAYAIEQNFYVLKLVTPLTRGV